MKRPNDSGAYAHVPDKQCRRDARVGARPAVFLVCFIVGACLTGCSFLKPAPDTARHFVLTPLPTTDTSKGASDAGAVSVVHVKIPAYLLDSSLAVRKGANEIDYPPTILWAERLNTGIPRVLTADLASVSPKDQFRVSLGGSEEVAMEIGVTVEQFDVSSRGQAVLVAKWRIFSPEGEKILRSGESHLSRNGPAPETDPSGAVGTLSSLIADFSQQLARALKEATPALAHEQ